VNPDAPASLAGAFWVCGGARTCPLASGRGSLPSSSDLHPLEPGGLVATPKQDRPSGTATVRQAEEKRWPREPEGSEPTHVIQAPTPHHVRGAADEDAAAAVCQAQRPRAPRPWRKRSSGSSRLVTRTPVRAQGEATQITWRSKPGLSKHGSWMRLPTKQRHASRRGLTKELELQLPRRSVNSETAGSPAASQALYRFACVAAALAAGATNTKPSNAGRIRLRRPRSGVTRPLLTPALGREVAGEQGSRTRRSRVAVAPALA
jgi:hypothetical protein